MDQHPASFAYKRGARGLVFITWNARKVRVLAGSEARKLVEQLEAASPEEQQLLMARHTGNFKRGNERR